MNGMGLVSQETKEPLPWEVEQANNHFHTHKKGEPMTKEQLKSGMARLIQEIRNRKEKQKTLFPRNEE